MLEAIGESKVSDNDITLTIEKQIFKLEVAVNDLLLVDVPDARN
jgi:hypothetical protein